LNPSPDFFLKGLSASDFDPNDEPSPRDLLNRMEKIFGKDQKSFGFPLHRSEIHFSMRFCPLLIPKGILLPLVLFPNEVLFVPADFPARAMIFIV